MTDELQTTKMAELAKKYNLSLVVLFGSKARSDDHEASDTDVAYQANTPLSIVDEAKFATDLVPLFGSKIDLVNIKAGSPLLARNIFKDGRVLYEESRGLFSDMFARSLRIYQETIPLYQAKLALL